LSFLDEQLPAVAAAAAAQEQDTVGDQQKQEKMNLKRMGGAQAVSDHDDGPSQAKRVRRINFVK